jgi:predicted DNA-binding transcriptional regulator AlpA
MSRQRALPDWPAALDEHWAAEYLSLSVGTFRTEVKAGRIPAAVWLTENRKAWLRRTLDRWLDDKAGKRSDLAYETSPDEMAAEWDMACDGASAARIS